MRHRTRISLLQEEGIIPQAQRKYCRDAQERRKSDRKYRKLTRLAGKKGITLDRLLWLRSVDRAWERVLQKGYPGAHMIYHDDYFSYVCEVIGTQRLRKKARNLAVKVIGLASVNFQALRAKPKITLRNFKYPRGHVLYFSVETLTKRFPWFNPGSDTEILSLEDCILQGYKDAVKKLQKEIDTRSPYTDVEKTTWSGWVFINTIQSWERLAKENMLDILDYAQFSQRLRVASRRHDIPEMLTCIERLVIPEICPDCKELETCSTCEGKTLLYPRENEARTALVQILDLILEGRGERELENHEKEYLETITKLAMSLDLRYEPLKDHEIKVTNSGEKDTVTLPAPEHALVIYTRAMRGIHGYDKFLKVIQHKRQDFFYGKTKVSYYDHGEGPCVQEEGRDDEGWAIYHDAVFCGRQCPRFTA